MSDELISGLFAELPMELRRKRYELAKQRESKLDSTITAFGVLEFVATIDSDDGESDV